MGRSVGRLASLRDTHEVLTNRGTSQSPNAVRFSFQRQSRSAFYFWSRKKSRFQRKVTKLVASILAAVTGLVVFVAVAGNRWFKLPYFGDCIAEERRTSVYQIERVLTWEHQSVSIAGRVVPSITVLLMDAEGRKVMKCLKQFLAGNAADTNALVFRSKRGGPLLETTILSQCLHPALRALGLPRSGFHAFRRGCNRRWELAGLNPAVHRQMMGHSSEAMTRLYSGEIPIQDVASAFSKTFGNQIDVLETMETEAAA